MRCTKGRALPSRFVGAATKRKTPAAATSPMLPQLSKGFGCCVVGAVEGLESRIETGRSAVAMAMSLDGIIDRPAHIGPVPARAHRRVVSPRRRSGRLTVTLPVTLPGHAGTPGRQEGP